MITAVEIALTYFRETLGRERHRRGHDEYGWTVGVVLRPEARAEGPKNAICDGQTAQILRIKPSGWL